MKKTAMSIIALCLLLCLVACGAPAAPQPSLTPTLQVADSGCTVHAPVQIAAALSLDTGIDYRSTVKGSRSVDILGDKLIYLGSGQRSIYLCDMDGSNETYIPIQEQLYDISSLCVYADTIYVCARNLGIYTITTDGSVQQLAKGDTQLEAVYEGGIVYSIYRYGPNGHPHLFLMDLDGGNQREIGALSVSEIDPYKMPGAVCEITKAGICYSQTNANQSGYNYFCYNPQTEQTTPVDGKQYRNLPQHTLPYLGFEAVYATDSSADIQYRSAGSSTTIYTIQHAPVLLYAYPVFQADAAQPHAFFFIFHDALGEQIQLLELMLE
ncbi:DUF5050 domain-containing protein [Eubacteriales bacterium OttesenSCG-928-N14]|nr:DUF5050 domain-containing protein [Eubacteriales bacterium OttesenSCG-928-N14]